MQAPAPPSFRYELRPVQLTDADTLGSWLADRRVAKGMNLQARAYSRDELACYILTFNKGANRTAGIVSRGSGRLVGVSINALDLPHRVAHFNLMIGEGFPAERDYAQIILLTIDWLFGLPEVEKVATRLDARRERLIGLLESYGMRREGLLKEEIRMPDGTRLDMAAHGVLPVEWAAIRARLLQAALVPEPLPFGTR